MQQRLEEMASVLMTQVDTLINTAELIEPKAFLKLESVAEASSLGEGEVCQRLL